MGRFAIAFKLTIPKGESTLQLPHGQGTLTLLATEESTIAIAPKKTASLTFEQTGTLRAVSGTLEMKHVNTGVLVSANSFSVEQRAGPVL